MGFLPVLPDPAERMITDAKESLRVAVGPKGEMIKGYIDQVRFLAEYAKPFIQDQRAAYLFGRLQRLYNWELVLPDVGDISGESVSVYAQEVSFGEYALSDISRVMYGIQKRGYAGFFDIPTMKVTFLCPIPDLVSIYLKKWKELMVEGYLHHPKMKYAKTGFARMQDRDGSVTEEFRISGLFPKTFPHHALSYREGGIEIYGIEFNVDNVEVKH